MQVKVRITANFEKNLEEIETFLANADAPRAFDDLIVDLSETVIPNLERFPGMGRRFLDTPMQSVETSNNSEKICRQIEALGKGGELREYVMSRYLVLYLHTGSVIDLLSIRHQRQLSFDFDALWTR